MTTIWAKRGVFPYVRLIYTSDRLYMCFWCWDLGLLVQVREVMPGEIVRLDASGITGTFGLSARVQRIIKPALCMFEYVYFARPDSLLEGQLVHTVRQRLGAQLAREAPVPGTVQALDFQVYSWPPNKRHPLQEGNAAGQ